MRRAVSLLPRFGRHLARAVLSVPILSVAILVAAGTPAAASGTGTAAALARPAGSRTDAAAERVRRAERALESVTRGVSARLAASPTVTWGADVEDPAALDASIALHLDATWTHDAAAVVRAEIDLIDALAALQDARRAEIKEALEVAGGRLRAGLAVEAANRNLADARAELAAAVAAGRGTDVALAELDVRTAELEVAHETAELARLDRRAQGMGMGAPPLFAPVAFDLPAADPAQVPAYRVRALEAVRATILLERQRAFGVVEAIELAARYESRTDGYQLDAAIGLRGGRPGAALGAEYRNQQDDQWSVGLSMRIVLDDETASDLAAAERAATHAAAALDTWTETFAMQAPEALRLARLAEDRLRVALDAQALRRRQVAELRAVGADPAAAAARLARSTDRTYLAWLRYVEEVDDYLALVGADWRVATPLD